MRTPTDYGLDGMDGTVNPHRIPTLTGAFLGNLKGLSNVSAEAPAAVLTGVLAAIGWAFGAANAELIILVLVSMLLDLMVGAGRAVADPIDRFSASAFYGGFMGKLFRVMLIPTAAVMDRAIIASGVPLPDTYGELFPIVKLVCIALIYAEITSALNHFRNGGAAPAAIAVIMRHLDRMKIGQEPPTRRDYDKAAAIEEADPENPRGKMGP